MLRLMYHFKRLKSDAHQSETLSSQKSNILFLLLKMGTTLQSLAAEATCRELPTKAATTCAVTLHTQALWVKATSTESHPLLGAEVTTSLFQLKKSKTIDKPQKRTGNNTRKYLRLGQVSLENRHHQMSLSSHLCLIPLQTRKKKVVRKLLRQNCKSKR